MSCRAVSLRVWTAAHLFAAHSAHAHGHVWIDPQVRALHAQLMSVRAYFAFDTQLRHGVDAFELTMLELFLKAQLCPTLE